MLLALFERQRAAVRVDGFRDVAETLDSFSDFNEGAELRRSQNLAMNHIANAVLGEERLPDIGLQLLDAQRQAAVFGLDSENDSA